MLQCQRCDKYDFAELVTNLVCWIQLPQLSDMLYRYTHQPQFFTFRCDHCGTLAQILFAAGLTSTAVARGDAMLAKAIPAIHGGFLAGWARWCRGFPMSPVTAPGADRMQMARWGGDGADPTTDTIHGGVHQHNLESSPQKMKIYITWFNQKLLQKNWNKAYSTEQWTPMMAVL